VGLLREARLPETYQCALLVLTEQLVIPEEVEIEKDLWSIEDDQVQDVGPRDLGIEVNQDKTVDRDDR